MSGGSVCVLCPNGRRNTIKYTPNMTILQILEEVCRKQNLKAEDYELKHHNKILDLSGIFRFSGLPNNAQLELVPATKVRLETDITLAVNLENGNRLVDNFTPNQTLKSVLEKLCPEYLSNEKSAVVIYMRQEIFGKNLETVTLRSLGITGGRAMIRLLDKAPEELKIQANVAVPLPHKPVEEQPYIRKMKESYCEEANEKIETKTNEKVETKTNESTSEGEVQRDPQKNTQSTDFKKGGTIDVLKLAKEKRKSTDSSFSKEKRANVMSEKADDLKNSSPERKTQTKEICNCKRDETMEVDCCGKCEENCVNVPDQNTEDQFVFLGERNAMLFSLETAQAIPSEDLPDDFFDLTIDDAKKILRDVRKQQHGMANTPLMTSALRNLEESKKQLRQLNRYKKAIIRIQFPDRTVLQGTFKPTETIKDVIAFVSEYLENKLTPFHLYTTPPKEVLEDSKNLIELGFVPGALIHFGTSNTDLINYLRTDLRDKFTSNSIASLAASRMRSQNSRACKSYETDDVDLDMNVDGSEVTDDSPSTSTGITHATEKITANTKSNLPKWFKP